MGMRTCSMLSRARDGDTVVRRRGLVTHGLEVQRNAERRADFVLTAVTLADGAGVVVVHHELLRQLLAKLPGRAGQDFLLLSGSTAHLKGASAGCRRSTVRTSSFPFLSWPTTSSS